MRPQGVIYGGDFKAWASVFWGSIKLCGPQSQGVSSPDLAQFDQKEG